MNEQKIGAFIQQLRKEKNMTQKELAGELNITDKAISKWERGLSCPDISLIIPLAKLLDVSTSELLNGEKESEPLQEKAENIIEETLVYSDRNTKNKLGRIKEYILIFLSAAFLLSIVICVICDFSITGNLTWSPIVIISLVFSWLLFLPFLKAKKNFLRYTLLILSLTIIPYLVLLGLILNVSMVYTLGSWISALSIIELWCVYGVFFKLRYRKLCAWGISLLITIPFCWGIEYLIIRFVQYNKANNADNIINIICLLVLSIICFGTDYVLAHREK